jgi:hypothetical protein
LGLKDSSLRDAITNVGARGDGKGVGQQRNSVLAFVGHHLESKGNTVSVDETNVVLASKLAVFTAD